MAIDISDIVLGHEVFSQFTPNERERFSEAGILKTFKSGEALARTGETWPYLFLVNEGSVNAMKESSEGRMFVVVQLGKGDLFWGLAFFQEGIHNPVTFQVAKPASIILWRRESVLPILRENGKVTWELSQIMVRRMLQASEVIEGLAFQPVAGRLARLLMDYPGKVNSGPTARSLTLDEMAARIGSTREMVCRFLQRFAEAGLIKITRTEFEVTDDKGLLEVAQKVKA